MTDSTNNEKRGWFQRLKDGLSRSSNKLGESLTGLFTKRRLDIDTLDDLDDVQDVYSNEDISDEELARLAQ